jgi:hypothetical protein
MKTAMFDALIEITDEEEKSERVTMYECFKSHVACFEGFASGTRLESRVLSPSTT